MKEYDSVITQVLVGQDQCGYPGPAVAGQKKPVVTALYEDVEKAVLATCKSRVAGPKR